MQNKLKHLEMTQTVINRMANNSFLIKGWCVTIVSALLALSAKDGNKRIVFVAYFPIMSFWILDGYFLWQERLFRSLYDTIRETPEEKISFSMDTSSFRQKARWAGAFFSLTLILFYGIMIVAVFVTYRALIGLF